MIFVHKGMKVLTSQQLNRRTQKYIDRDWPQWKRERSIRKADGLFDTYMDGVEADTDINRTTNEFNWNLEQFQKATKRLEQYELSVGVPELSREVPTGETVFSYEEDRVVEVTETVVTPAIEPLEATVEVVTVDEEGNETTETVDNPLIVQDEEERAQAQRIIDNTADEIYEFLELEIPTEEEETEEEETEDGED
jgi:hypothetical protein